jgi:plastocyanin
MRLFLVSVAAAMFVFAMPTLADKTVPTNTPAVQISIENYTFKPASVTIPVGATVTWKNLDDDPHTATADDGSFNSKGLAQGDTYSFTFTKPGTYQYHCSVHPFMKATVIVKEAN